MFTMQTYKELIHFILFVECIGISAMYKVLWKNPEQLLKKQRLTP